MYLVLPGRIVTVMDLRFPLGPVRTTRWRPGLSLRLVGAYPRLFPSTLTVAQGETLRDSLPSVVSFCAVLFVFERLAMSAFLT